MMWCVLRTCAEESDIFVLAGEEAARDPSDEREEQVSKSSNRGRSIREKGL